MNEVLVIGHRNPDTDAICSAIGYAEFKRQTGLPGAVAARCGDTNARIDFVLNRFRTPAPRFVADVLPRIRDVMNPEVLSVSPDTTAAQALGMMESRDLRVVPILTADRTCLGLISLYKMSKLLFPTPNRPVDSRLVFATLRNLARTLQGQLVYGVDPDREEELILMVGAMKLETFTQRLAKFPREQLLVIVGDREEIQLAAIQAGVRVVVMTGGLPVEKAVVDAARQNEVALVVSPHDSATTALLSRASVAVRRVLHERFLSFREDEVLAPAKLLAASSEFHAFPVLDSTRRCIGILTKSDFLKRPERKLILVDHNEFSQAVPGAEQVDIIEVVDHHRIGLATHQPILFRNEPVGSTSTLVADCFLSQAVPMSEEIAGLLLAGLVSDTLNLTSPTSTEKDAAILRELERRAKVNAAAFTEILFASGSVLISKSVEEAIVADCKEYVEKEHRFSVAQIEELGFDHFWKTQSEVTAALERYRTEREYLFSALLVTDVVRQTSLLLMAGPRHVLRLVDYPESRDGIYELDAVVSRKKQLLPYLTHLLQRLES